MVSGVELAAQTSRGLSSFPSSYVVNGDTAYFSATTSLDSEQLWKTDGTTEGTTRISAFPPSQRRLSNLFTLQGRTLAVAAMDTLQVYEMNGANVWLVRALNVPVAGSVVATGIGTSGILFTQSLGNKQYKLWKADLNSGETTAIVTVDSTSTPYVATFGNRAFFYVYPPSAPNTADLWCTDGTPAGTASITTDIRDVTVFGDRLLVQRYTELLLSDGTAAGTSQVAPTFAYQVTVVGSVAYFAASDGLWKTDGTAAGTTLVKALPGIWSVQALGDGRLVVAAINSSLLELWASDGTSAGTTQIVSGVSAQSAIRQGTVGARAYLKVATGQIVNLWTTDGTTAGTQNLKQLTIGNNLGAASVAVNGKLVFTNNDLVHETEPWVSDGTPAGTKLLLNLEPETILRGRVTDAITGTAPASTTVRLFIGSSTAVTVPLESDGAYAIEGIRPGSNYKLGTVSTDEHIDQVWKNIECSPYCDGQPIVVSGASVRDGFDFSLRRGVVFTGQVTDAATKVAVTTRPTIYAGYYFGNILRSATADGTYRIGPLEPGSYVVWSHDDIAYSSMIHPNISCAGGCDTASAAPQTYAAGTYTLNFALKTFGKIRGHVSSTNPNLTPLAYLTFWTLGAAAPWASDVPTVDGDFEATLPDGKWQISVETKDGLNLPTWYSTANCRPCTRAQATTIVPVAGATTSGYNVVLPRISSTITGTITDQASSTGVANLPVHAMTAGGVLASGTTNASGFYSIPVAAGTYFVYSDARSPYASELYDGAGGRVCNACDITTGTPVVVGEQTTVPSINMSLAGNGMISGHVSEAATNAAVAFRTVRVYDSGAFVVATTSTNASGDYTAVVPLNGTYYVHVPAAAAYLGELYNEIPCDGCNVTSGTPVTIPVSAARTGINFTLDKLGMLTGAVLNNANSQGLPNVSLTLTGPSTRFGGTTSNGSFTISNIAAGSYTLTTEASGFVTDTRTVTIAKNQTTSVTVRLNATQTGAAPGPGVGLTGPVFTKTKP